MIGGRRYVRVAAALAVSLALLELGARGVVAVYRRAHLPEPALAFYEKNMADTHHLRDPERLAQMGLEPTGANLDRLVYTDVVQGAVPALVQGDSWAEELLSPRASARFAELAGVVSVSIAGTGSYSPSPMTAQLDLLVERFGLRPRLVVAIIDQTDIGDEVCRYAGKRAIDASGRVTVAPFGERDHPDQSFNMTGYFHRGHVLHGDALALTKLLRIAWYDQWVSRHPAPGAAARCRFADIVRPLQGRSSQAEYAHFARTVADYIQRVLSHHGVERLMFLTHFHRDHVSGAYTVNVADLVEAAVRDTAFGDRIDVVSILPGDYPEEDLATLFEPDDRSSHLTKEAHAGRYTDAIVHWLRARAGRPHAVEPPAW
jgi:hypothetical protein